MLHLLEKFSDIACRSLLILFISFSLSNYANSTTIELNENKDHFVVGPYLSYIEDSKGALSFDDIKDRNHNEWIKHDKPIFNQGYTDSVFWLSFEIALPADKIESETFFLEFDLPFFGLVDTYILADNQLIQDYQTGLKRPLSNRAYPHETFVFPINVKPNKLYRIIIRGESVSAILAPLTLYKEQKFHQEHANKNTLIGFYFGLSIILAVYNFFLYLSTKDFNYFLYTVHVLGLCWLQAALRGFSATYIWEEEFRIFAYYEPTMVIWGSFCTSLIFTRSFLKLPSQYPLWDKVFLAFIATSLVFFFGTFIFPMNFVLGFFNVFSPISILLVLGTAIYCLRQGNRTARFFLLGWSFFLSSALIKTIYHVGLLPTNFITLNPMIIGSALEGILLSLALADRINWIQKEKEEAQEQAVEALERSNRIKDDFLISISHELRTPLAGIIGALSLSKSTTKLDAIEENNTLIEKSADRMADTIDSILSLSEINSGDIKVHKTDFNFILKTTDLLEAMNAQCQEKSLNFISEIKIPKDKIYHGDIAKIRLILRHLTQNAINFTHKGHVSLLIEEENNLKSCPGISIHIHDTGEGIPEEKLSIIFEAFQQLSGGYARSHEGLGIGLTICKRLLDLMGGTISIESKENLGTHCLVWIPIAEGESLQQETAQAAVQENTHVLVVEDNLVNQKVLTGMLRKLSCKVDVANNGKESLEHVAKEKPDIIFMDCQMPEMDGIEATKILRESYSDETLPIVAVTANALSNDRERCFSAGMNDYLVKPVKIEAIQDALGRWV